MEAKITNDTITARDRFFMRLTEDIIMNAIDEPSKYISFVIDYNQTITLDKNQLLDLLLIFQTKPDKRNPFKTIKPRSKYESRRTNKQT